MRYAFASFAVGVLLLSANVWGQTPQVLLVGVTHTFPDRNAERFGAVSDAVMAFQPQHIATEFMPPSLRATAMKLGKKSLRKTMKQLQEKNNLATVPSSEQIQTLYTRLQQSPSLSKRAELAAHLYVAYDLANFYYQLYQLFEALEPMKQNLRVQWLQTFEQYLMEDRVLIALALQLDGSEFGNLIFPIADTLQIEKLHGVDDQRWFRKYQKAKQKSEKRLRRALNLNARELRASLWGTYDSLDYFATQQSRALQFLNTAYHDTLVVQAFSSMRSLETSRATQKYWEYWQWRNQAIAQNIATLCSRYPTERIVVFLGANHIPFVAEWLHKTHEISFSRLLFKE